MRWRNPFRTRYRIVHDGYNGYRAQERSWHWPWWEDIVEGARYHHDQDAEARIKMAAQRSVLIRYVEPW